MFNKELVMLLLLLTLSACSKEADNYQSNQNSNVFEAERLKSGNSTENSNVQAGDTTPEAPELELIEMMDIDDLRLDMESLNDKEVRVRGKGQYMMDIFMLTKNDADMNPIIIDISRLERNDRKDILKNCSDVMRQCEVTIQGTVGDVSFQSGIIAEKIEW